jgi:Ca2+-binding EF-hand superfamily protein
MKWQNMMAGVAMVSLLATGAGAAEKAAATGMRGDVDNSGTLTALEIKEERRTFLLALDADKDGKVKVEEFVNGFKKDFDTRDANRDGVLIADEFVVYWCGKAALPKAKAKVAKAAPLKNSMIKHQDTSGDGKVDQDECVAFWSVRFDAADTNKDGKLSKEEFTEVIKQAAQRIDTNKDGIIAIEEYTATWGGTSKEKQKAKPVPAK